MGPKVLARFAVLLAIVLAPVAVPAQSTGQSGSTRHAPAVATSPRVIPQDDPSPAPAVDSDSGLHSLQPAPHVTVATPAPAARSWTWQEQATWGANILLAVLGYAGIMMALSLLKKIERQTAFGSGWLIRFL